MLNPESDSTMPSADCVRPSRGPRLAPRANALELTRSSLVGLEEAPDPDMSGLLLAPPPAPPSTLRPEEEKDGADLRDASTRILLRRA